MSEKVFQAVLAEAIPIVWGCSTLRQLLRPGCYVDLFDALARELSNFFCLVSKYYNRARRTSFSLYIISEINWLAYARLILLEY